MNSSRNEYFPDEVSPPGETLGELLQERDIGQRELARRTGRPAKTINEIVNGKAEITPETAIQLERVLGVPARFWLEREHDYRCFLAGREEEQRLRAEADWLKQFPISEMVRRGWIGRRDSKVDQIRELLGFFGVASPEQWRAMWLVPDALLRKADAFESHTGKLAAWLRRGEIEASRSVCRPFDADQFRSVLPQLRALTLQSAEVFDPALRRICSECGVAVVFVREIPGCAASGATRWVSSDRAMILLSLRYKSDDQLWFTFFHEAGHILLHRKRALFIEGIRRGSGTDREEAEANQFAAELLIPRRAYAELLRSTRFSEAAVRAFAAEVNVSPGVVVGRLQHDGHLPHSHLNRLKRRLDLVEVPR